MLLKDHFLVFCILFLFYSFGLWAHLLWVFIGIWCLGLPSLWECPSLSGLRCLPGSGLATSSNFMLISCVCMYLYCLGEKGRRERQFSNYSWVYKFGTLTSYKYIPRVSEITYLKLIDVLLILNITHCKKYMNYEGTASWSITQWSPMWLLLRSGSRTRVQKPSHCTS